MNVTRRDFVLGATAGAATVDAATGAAPSYRVYDRVFA